MIRTISARKARIEELIMLFLTGFVQVCLVAMNTVFIAKGKIVPMFLVSFLIGLVWIFNIRKTVAGKVWDKVAYCLGSASGTVAGFILANSVINRL